MIYKHWIWTMMAAFFPPHAIAHLSSSATRIVQWSTGLNKELFQSRICKRFCDIPLTSLQALRNASHTAQETGRGSLIGRFSWPNNLGHDRLAGAGTDTHTHTHTSYCMTESRESYYVEKDIIMGNVGTYSLIMHHFSQEMVAITNSLVLLIFLFFFAVEHMKKKKEQDFSPQKSKNGLDKSTDILLKLQYNK